MKEIMAQGDLQIERADDVAPSGTIVTPRPESAIVLAEGEATGHRHAIHDAVTPFRDDALARDIPANLNVGHVQVHAAVAKVEHEEHAALVLTKGTYRVRRQRELEPMDARVVAD